MSEENAQFTIKGLHQAAVELLAQQLLPKAEVDEAVKSFIDSFQRNGKMLSFKDRSGYSTDIPVQQAVANALSESIRNAAVKRAQELMQEPEIIQMIDLVAKESVIQTMTQIPNLIGTMLAQRIMAQTDPYGNRQEAQMSWRMESILGILNQTRERVGLPTVSVPG